jgi:hypothetical protein
MKQRIDLRGAMLLVAVLCSGFPTPLAWGYDMGGGGSSQGGVFLRRPLFPGGGFHQVPRGSAPAPPAGPSAAEIRLLLRRLRDIQRFSVE